MSKGSPVLLSTSHPALTRLCGCLETFARFSPLPPLFFMSLRFPVLAGNAEVHARKGCLHGVLQLAGPTL